MELRLNDKRDCAQLDALLHREGISRDRNLDYTCGLFDEAGTLIGTGSCYKNTIRCVAVSREHHGEGLLNRIISHLMDVQTTRGNLHIFLYTKPETAGFMADLGFHEIVRVDGKLVFMENRRHGFADYCAKLAAFRRDAPQIAGIVMNANPFTLGHLYLVERAAQENDIVHLFVLSEEAGPIPFFVRKQLVMDGVAHLPNVLCHASGLYIISSATFPSYFLQDRDAVITAQAELDLKIFGQIANALGIQRRYVGTEPSSHVTALYNQIMLEQLPNQGMECIEIPRLTRDGQAVSASTVRQAIHDGRLETVRDLLPPSAYSFFAGPEGKAVISAIQAEKDVIHY